MKNIDELIKEVEADKAYSAWSRGVNAYAGELLEELKEGIELGYIDAEDISNGRLLERALLNGAHDWTEYSFGGCSLIYNGDIAERLCNKTELKKTNNGEKRPNRNEEWLDVQARALYQASNLIRYHAFAV